MLSKKHRWKENKTVSISMVGDIWPIQIESVQISKRINDPASDLYIANLESPIYPKGSLPRLKSGPHHVSSRETLFKVRESFDELVFTLANNHLMDYGQAGLIETLKVCDQIGVITVGAGKTFLEASAPKILEVNGVRIGVLGLCETQFGVASARRGGVASFDPRIYAAIRDLAATVDIPIVSIHCGAELCPWPSPFWQKTLRSFVDVGAKIVHGHHTHVPKGYESYRNGVIFYGLGSFLIDPDEWSVPHHQNTLWSLIADYTHDAKEISWSLQTIVVERSNSKVSVRLSNDVEFQKHSEYLVGCNLPLSDETFLTGCWQEAAIRMYELWYSDLIQLHPSRQQIKRSVIRDRLSALKQGILKAAYGSKPISIDTEMLWYHLFSCETHLEVLSTALGVLCGELEDLRNEDTRRLADDLMPWSQENITEMIWPGPGDE